MVPPVPTGDENIDLSVRIIPQLDGGGLGVDGRIRGLLNAGESMFGVPWQRLGTRDGAFMPSGPGVKTSFGAEHCHASAALERHRFGHGKMIL